MENNAICLQMEAQQKLGDALNNQQFIKRNGEKKVHILFLLNEKVFLNV